MEDVGETGEWVREHRDSRLQQKTLEEKDRGHLDGRVIDVWGVPD